MKEKHVSEGKERLKDLKKRERVNSMQKYTRSKLKS